MNLAVAIAVYTAMSKELRLPLRFLGKPGAYDKLLEMSDADLLARAAVCVAADPRCANQAFNINNGDLFRWNEMWPRLAHFFELNVAPPLSLPLSVVMANKETLWQAMVAKYGLALRIYQKVSCWGFADFVLRLVRRWFEGAALRLSQVCGYGGHVFRHLCRPASAQRHSVAQASRLAAGW